MQIHELTERKKVRQFTNRGKAGIASQLIKKANANSQAKLTQQAQQAAPTSTPAVSSTNVVSGGPTPAEQEKLNARIAAATAAQAPAAQAATAPAQGQAAGGQATSATGTVKGVKSNVDVSKLKKFNGVVDVTPSLKPQVKDAKGATWTKTTAGWTDGKRTIDPKDTTYLTFDDAWRTANGADAGNVGVPGSTTAPTSTPAVSSTNVVSGGPTPAQPTRSQNIPVNPNVKPGGSKEAQAFRAQQAAQQPAPAAPAPVQQAQPAAAPTQQKPLTKWGAIKNAAVDSTRSKWDPAYAYGDPRPTAAQPGTVAPDMTAELAKIGITNNQLAGIGKILQQTGNYNTRLTNTGDPAVDKFLQAMGYNVR